MTLKPFNRLRVVVCGSFHREPEQLISLLRELEATNCQVISPLSIDFSDLGEQFVKTTAETNLGLSISELERFHLRAIYETDFVWLHAPNGYIGVSGAFEIGFALALNKPTFCLNRLRDNMLNTQISVARSVFSALEQLG